MDGPRDDGADWVLVGGERVARLRRRAVPVAVAAALLGVALAALLLVRAGGLGLVPPLAWFSVLFTLVATGCLVLGGLALLLVLRRAVGDHVDRRGARGLVVIEMLLAVVGLMTALLTVVTVLGAADGLAVALPVLLAPLALLVLTLTTATWFRGLT